MESWDLIQNLEDKLELIREALLHKNDCEYDSFNDDITGLVSDVSEVLTKSLSLIETMQ